MGAEDGMWTEAHRARHEPDLKELVAACAVEEIATWLERADPPRSGQATPVRRVVGAVAWHLRVGGPWRALPASWPPWRTFQLPTSSAATVEPSTMSVRRDMPRHMTVLPAGGSLPRAR